MIASCIEFQWKLLNNCWEVAHTMFILIFFWFFLTFFFTAKYSSNFFHIILETIVEKKKSKIFFNKLSIFQWFLESNYLNCGRISMCFRCVWMNYPAIQRSFPWNTSYSDLCVFEFPNKMKMTSVAPPNAEFQSLGNVQCCWQSMNYIL
jgi:hypothetical protein